MNAKDTQIRINESIEIPYLSKKAYWLSLGPLFLLIGIIFFIIGPDLALKNLGYFNIAIFKLIFWILFDIMLYLILCATRTKVVKNGVVIEKIF